MTSARAERRLRSGRSLLLLALLSMISLSFQAQLAQVASAESDAGTSVSKMNFHMYSVIYKNSNSSIFAYNGADTNPPTYPTPATTVVSCAVRYNSFLSFGQDVWVGLVSWITQPLAENVTVRGDFSMTVWMSTSDATPTASGYAFGISEVDSTGTPIGEPLYQYHPDIPGTTLTATPTSYNLVLSIDRTFLKGNMIGFFAIVGSTTRGWQYQVYFDSPSANSFAELPIVNLPIPEFSQFGMVIALILVAVLCQVLIRRKSWGYRNNESSSLLRD